MHDELPEEKLSLAGFRRRACRIRLLTKRRPLPSLIDRSDGLRAPVGQAAPDPLGRPELEALQTPDARRHLQRPHTERKEHAQTWSDSVKKAEGGTDGNDQHRL